MAKYLPEVRKFENHFKKIEIKYILRRDNTLVDQLSKLGSSDEAILPNVVLEQLHAPSISTIAPTNVAYLKRPLD